MNKTLPNLAYPQDITWWQLLFVVLPASILSIVFFIVTVTIMAIWQFSLWAGAMRMGVNSNSQTGADND